MTALSEEAGGSAKRGAPASRRPPRKLAGGFQGRYLLLGTTLFLVALGLLMIYSASSASDFVRYQDSAYHLRRQLVWVVLGLAVMFAVERVDYRRLERFSWSVWGISVAGLLAVLVVGIGKWGATRWLLIGPVTVQPSEYAKLGCVMVAASLLARWGDEALPDKDLGWRLAFVSVPVVALVMAQPDMGTTMSIMVALYLLVLLAGLAWRHLIVLALGGGLLAAAAIALAPYRAARFFAFIDPWADPRGDGYQTIQSLLAFGSGGLTGVGLGLSRQKFFYLPAAHTDFIFAIVGEELGLLGSLAVVSAFGVLAYAGFRVAVGARDRFGRLLAGGLTTMIVAQALMNMAAVTGLMPVTGIPLPLVSFGGSSLTFTLGCVGLVLSVSRHGARKARRRSRSKEVGPPDEVRDERRRDGRPRLSCIDGGRGAARRRA